MEYIIGAAWVVIECISDYLIMDSLLPARKNNISMFLAAMCTFIFLPQILLDLPAFPLSVLALLGMAFYLFGGTTLMKIMSITVCAVFSVLGEMIPLFVSRFLLHISVSELMTKKILYVSVITSGLLLTLLLAWAVRRQRKAREFGLGNLPAKTILLSMIFPIISTIMIAFVFYNSLNHDDLSVGEVLLCASLVIANIAILYMLSAQEKSIRDEREKVVLSQQVQLQMNYAKSWERSYEQQRRATHDFSKKLQVMQQLLNEGRIDDLKMYLGEIIQPRQIQNITVQSHHPIVDAVLCVKLEDAEENQIDMQVRVNDLSQVRFPEDELAVLLSNLLDNAIEACLRFDGERKIRCSILKKDQLMLSISNTSVPVVIQGLHIPTSKLPKEEHGYGLPNVVRIMKKHNCVFTMQYTEPWFRFVAEIPIDD